MASQTVKLGMQFKQQMLPKTTKSKFTIIMPNIYQLRMFSTENSGHSGLFLIRKKGKIST